MRAAERLSATTKTQRALLFTFALFFPLEMLLACGNENPNTTPSGNGGPSASASMAAPSADAGAVPSASASSAPAASASVAEIPAVESDPCEGADLDLVAMLSNRACHPNRDAAPTPANAASLVKVTLTSSSDHVAPGGHLDLNVEIANSGSAPIPLYFAGDLTLTPVVVDAKGKQIAPPSGNAPKNPDPKCATEVECRRHTSHVVIAPGGKAHARIGWDANKVAWPKVGPTTCCTVHVDSVASGALPNGTYKIKVPIPYEENQGNPADGEVTIKVTR